MVKYLLKWDYKIADQYGSTVSGTQYLGIFDSEDACKSAKDNPKIKNKIRISPEDELLVSKFNIIKVDYYE